MNGYRLACSCPTCGGRLEHVVSSRVFAETECSAIARCPACRREWQLVTVIRECPRFRGAT